MQSQWFFSRLGNFKIAPLQNLTCAHDKDPFCTKPQIYLLALLFSNERNFSALEWALTCSRRTDYVSSANLPQFLEAAHTLGVLQIGKAFGARCSLVRCVRANIKRVHGDIRTHIQSKCTYRKNCGLL